MRTAADTTELHRPDSGLCDTLIDVFQTLSGTFHNIPSRSVLWEPFSWGTKQTVQYWKNLERHPTMSCWLSRDVWTRARKHNINHVFIFCKAAGRSRWLADWLPLLVSVFSSHEIYWQVTKKKNTLFPSEWETKGIKQGGQRRARCHCWCVVVTDSMCFNAKVEEDLKIIQTARR